MIFEFDLTGIFDGNRKDAPHLFIRPNPSQEASFIEFTLPETGFVSLKVYSLQGALVKVLCDEILQPGDQSFLWDGKDRYGAEVSRGLYMIMLQAPGMNVCTGAVRN
jgi:flagellar hook assembly protein FlgD